MSGYKEVGSNLLIHMCNVFDIMQKEASIEVNPVNPEVEYRVWTGYGMKLVTEELKLSNGMYTRIFAALQEGEYIKQLRRGSGSTPSAYILLARPDLESFTEQRNGGSKAIGMAPTGAYVGQNISDLKDRVSALEKSVQELNNLLLALMAEKIKKATND